MNTRLYDAQDMVKIACRECNGCGECCSEMGESIRLDPLDVHELCFHLTASFTDLLDNYISLHVEDRLILPHLKMQEQTDHCGFLQENGRCGIHLFRPGYCRLFPLGRDYSEGSLRYFIVDDGCPKPAKSKIKVSKWLEIEDMEAYERYLIKWHDFIKAARQKLMSLEKQEDVQKINMYLLNTFYTTPYDPMRDFYKLFEMRLLRGYRAIEQK